MNRYLKLVSYFAFFLGSLSIQALEFKISWNDDFEKEIRMSCTPESEQYCIDLCGSGNQCIGKEDYCRDCAGTGLYVRNLFQNLGVHFRNTNEKVNPYDLMDLLRSNNYFTISSKSIFNLTTRFNSKEMRKKFRALCNNTDPYPIIFLEAEEVSRLPGKIRYVTCKGPEGNTQVFKMTDKAKVTIGNGTMDSLSQ